MISWNSRTTCEEARLYYCDCLEDPNMEEVPWGVREHLKGCLHCQKEIKRLKGRLYPASDKADHERASHVSMLNTLFPLSAGIPAVPLPAVFSPIEMRIYNDAKKAK